MNKKKDVLKLLDEMKNNNPSCFFERFDSMKRGTYFVLFYLSDHRADEVVSVDLSNALNVSTARMAKLLQNMEKKNLILKNKSHKDARKTVVKITFQGLNELEKFTDLIVDNVRAIIEEIGEEKFKEFISIASKIQKISESKKELFINDYDY